MKAIEIENLSFKYNADSAFVIKNLSLSVDKGEFLCVLGENGSGKSTLSRLINGLLEPTEGSVKVFGLDTTDKKNVYEIRKRVGMVFQNPDNQMVATIVEDDIAFGPENVGIPSKEIGERIDFALNAVDMQKYRFSGNLLFWKAFCKELPFQFQAVPSLSGKKS
jgi:energy-coupling factor transport system ATP-binding protein